MRSLFNKGSHKSYKRLRNSLKHKAFRQGVSRNHIRKFKKRFGTI